MNKEQAYNSFWSGFGVLAFEENSVPTQDVLKSLAESKHLPSDRYITYQVLTDDLDHPVFPTASIYHRSTSWEVADTLSNLISERIQNMSTIKLDNGRMFITKGSPFAQHQDESGDTNIRRIILNLGVEFFTEY
jgi:hypothetical protein